MRGDLVVMIYGKINNSLLPARRPQSQGRKANGQKQDFRNPEPWPAERPAAFSSQNRAGNSPTGTQARVEQFLA